MSSIVLFDGVCNFCSDAVNFIIDRDPEGRFKFAPLQSAVGRELREKYQIDDDIDSIVLIEDGQAFTRSDAALRIAKGLSGIWSNAYMFNILPRPLRDFYYDFFASVRYRLFGRKESCMVPTPDVRSRFLEGI